MSDMTKIEASRAHERNNAGGPDMRAVLAAEHTADALEGIRQDLTLIAGQLVHVVQQLTVIGSKR